MDISVKAHRSAKGLYCDLDVGYSPLMGILLTYLPEGFRPFEEVTLTLASFNDLNGLSYLYVILYNIELQDTLRILVRSSAKGFDTKLTRCFNSLEVELKDISQDLLKQYGYISN